MAAAFAEAAGVPNLITARDRWRYAPGTRDGVPEAMWYRVPIDFKLEE